ncbi:hypothetical protein AAA799O18_00672, partial [Marine Group I thaumarchaeote SCGC AAA799-O18]
MSKQERELMQLVDGIILEADPIKLSELQQIDINTQLEGVWFYDLCNPIERISQKPDITIS